MAMPIHQALTEAGIPCDVALDQIAKYVEKTEAHNTAGLDAPRDVSRLGPRLLIER